MGYTKMSKVFDWAMFMVCFIHITIYFFKPTRFSAYGGWFCCALWVLVAILRRLQYEHKKIEMSKENIDCIMQTIFSSALYCGGRSDRDNAERLAISVLVYLRDDKEFIENYFKLAAKALDAFNHPKKRGEK